MALSMRPAEDALPSRPPRYQTLAPPAARPLPPATRFDDADLRDREKRQCPRRSLRCRLAMLDSVDEPGEEATVAQAECLNVSRGGLYAIVPIGYGVAIGRRYRFILTVGERGPEPGASQIVSQHGEVVRAELLLGEDGSGDRVGIGVRLQGPRTGLIPMPL